MTAFAFLIPIVFAVFLLIFYRQKVVWWEYLILIVPSLVIAASLYFGMVSYTTSDTEYLGDYVTGVKYYEDWNEYIHRTCTRKVGKRTYTYDCSYVAYHPRTWVQVLSNGYEYSIPSSEYNRLTQQWKTSAIFIDMNRRYFSKDGDCYLVKWDNAKEHAKTRTIDHSYTNKIKGSHSVFGFSNIDDAEAKKLGLFAYPELTDQSGSDNDRNLNPFLGYKPTAAELQRWQYINGWYGPHHQFRIFNLVFYNKPRSIVQDQRSYWEGGNKNEMVTCFCLDSVTKKILWVDAFSWCDKPTYEVNLRSYLTNKDKLDFMQLADWTEQAIPKYWKRKEFKDFDYIDVELSGTQLTWMLIIILVFNLGMSIYVVRNNKVNRSENQNIFTGFTDWKR